MATIKQELAFDKVVENGGNVSRAMMEVGYSENTAKTPQKLTESKGWIKLVEKYLPDNHLGEKHREFLDAKRIIRSYKKGDLEYETEETDPNAVRALDMAYKIKGKYKEETNVHNTLVVISKESADKYGITPSSEANT